MLHVTAIPSFLFEMGFQRGQILIQIVLRPGVRDGQNHPAQSVFHLIGSGRPLVFPGFLVVRKQNLDMERFVPGAGTPGEVPAFDSLQRGLSRRIEKFHFPVEPAEVKSVFTVIIGRQHMPGRIYPMNVLFVRNHHSSMDADQFPI